MRFNSYDERHVMIPNADLFTHSLIVNTARELRHRGYAFTVWSVADFRTNQTADR